MALCIHPLAMVDVANGAAPHGIRSHVARPHGVLLPCHRQHLPWTRASWLGTASFLTAHPLVYHLLLLLCVLCCCCCSFRSHRESRRRSYKRCISLPTLDRARVCLSLSLIILWRGFLQVILHEEEHQRIKRRRGSTRPRVWAKGALRYCTKCQEFKPPRAHHCSECGVCILKMVC